MLVQRDLKVRYAGATLGAFWNLIHPLVMILIYIVIFSSLIPGKSGEKGGGYAVHLCSGMLVWLVFAETLGRSGATLTDNANFLRKVSFPPLVLHASVLFNVLMVYSAGLVAFWLILTALGGAPPLAGLATLGVMALAGIAASGLGMILSALHVFFRDTAQLVSIMLQIGFWMNPIVYPKSILRNSGWKLVTGILDLNPMDAFISTAQQLFGSPSADPAPSAPIVIFVFPAVCLVAGLLVFRKLLPDVRDSI